MSIIIDCIIIAGGGCRDPVRARSFQPTIIARIYRNAVAAHREELHPHEAVSDLVVLLEPGDIGLLRLRQGLVPLAVLRMKLHTTIHA